jgi:hypothetical protein
VPYQVTSVSADGAVIKSKTFSLTANPTIGKPLRILLTSDRQLMPMVTANLQKVAETLGRVDAIFMAGDLTNIADRASEWFDDRRGGAFFLALQGRGSYKLKQSVTETLYKGGALIQHAPIFPAIGNHEVMGRFDRDRPLNYQFEDAIPRENAVKLPPASANARSTWRKDMLTAAKVQLVYYGYTHIWNRFVNSEGMHFLESSNVGNSYGACVGDKRRNVPTGNRQNYAVTDNPNGLTPIFPSIAPLNDDLGNPQPYLASNDITAFSILDTETGTVSSYRFDTRTPLTGAIKFDEFVL